MRILTTLLLASGLLFAQEAAKEPESPAVPRESAVIQVKNLSGDAFDRLVHLLGAFNTNISSDSQLRTIVVYAPADVITQVKKVVADLDRPGSEAALGHNIEVTLSFLRCGSEPSTGAGQQPVPADLQSVVRQLQAATTCMNPTLWDTVPMRMQEGKESLQAQRLPAYDPSAPNQPTLANIKMQPVALGTKEGQGRYVRFDTIAISMRVAIATKPGSGGFQYYELSIRTAGDFLENQKTVLGKVTGSDEEPIFVVVALKILD